MLGGTRPTRRNILFPVSRPTHFFSKKAKKKRGGVVFRWLVAATPFFFATLYLLRKDGRGLVIVRRPTDLQLRETVGIPETRYFFWLALGGEGVGSLEFQNLVDCKSVSSQPGVTTGVDWETLRYFCFLCSIGYPVLIQ